MLSTPNIYSMTKVYSSLKYLSKGSMAISKRKKEKEKKGEKRKRRKRFVSPLVEKNDKKRGSHASNKKRGCHERSKFHIYHTHALSWSRFMTCCSFYPSV
jgi:hypothetical protein